MPPISEKEVTRVPMNRLQVLTVQGKDGISWGVNKLKKWGKGITQSGKISYGSSRAIPVQCIEVLQISDLVWY